LNDRGAKYIVIGGIAIARLGFVRATEDIDLLVETSTANEKAVLQAVAMLPDHAASELIPGDIAKYEVIRVADEIVVDLMSRACGIDYDHAVSQIQFVQTGGVTIPFASRELMIRLKQGPRPKDQMDRQFLLMEK
jgi:predicted nucleotidyltransferase